MRLHPKEIVMKKIFFIATLLSVFSLPIFGQKDTIRVEQYCRLISYNKMFSTKVNIDVDYGEVRKYFQDTRMRDEETGKLKKFNSVVDALNYLGAQGWTLVNAFPVQEGNSFSYQYYFKKMFPKIEDN